MLSGPGPRSLYKTAYPGSHRDDRLVQPSKLGGSVRDKTLTQIGLTHRLFKPSTLEHGKLDIVGGVGILLVHR